MGVNFPSSGSLQEAEKETKQMKVKAESQSLNEQQNGFSEETMKVLHAVDALLARAEGNGAASSREGVRYE